MIIVGIISKCLYKTMICTGRIVENKFNYYTNNAFKINKKSLFNIIAKNKDTEFGKKYNFNNIKTLQDFKENIPLTEYDFYKGYINKMIKGENNILVKEPIEYFAHTSGTTNSQKLLPMTRTSRVIASKYMAILVQRYCYKNFRDNFTYEKGIMIADIVKTKYTEAGLPICSATSGGMESIKKLLPYMYTSPIEIMYIENNYEIVLTNYSGLYRYRLGDVIKVLGYVNESPEIEFLYRRKQVLNMVSEKTTEEHLTNALKNTMRKKELTLVDYTTEADNSISPGRYIIYLELKNKINKNEISMLENTLDNELQKSNLAYGRFRKSHRLQKTKVKILNPNTFSNIKSNLCKNGISKNQIKVPRVITNTNSKFNMEFNKIKNKI